MSIHPIGENDFVNLYKLEEGEFVRTVYGVNAVLKKRNLAKINYKTGNLSVNHQYIVTFPIRWFKGKKVYFSLDNVKAHFSERANEAFFKVFSSHYVVNGKAHNKIEFNSFEDNVLGDGFDVITKGESKAYLEVDFNKANLTGKCVKIKAHFKRTDGKGHTAVDIFVCLDIK